MPLADTSELLRWPALVTDPLSYTIRRDVIAKVVPCRHLADWGSPLNRSAPGQRSTRRQQLSELLRLDGDPPWPILRTTLQLETGD